MTAPLATIGFDAGDFVWQNASESRPGAPILRACRRVIVALFSYGSTAWRAHGVIPYKTLLRRLIRLRIFWPMHHS